MSLGISFNYFSSDHMLTLDGLLDSDKLDDLIKKFNELFINNENDNTSNSNNEINSVNSPNNSPENTENTSQPKLKRTHVESTEINSVNDPNNSTENTSQPNPKRTRVENTQVYFAGYINSSEDEVNSSINSSDNTETNSLNDSNNNSENTSQSRPTRVKHPEERFPNGHPENLTLDELKQRREIANNFNSRAGNKEDSEREDQ
jgi:hypothetical protein